MKKSVSILLALLILLPTAAGLSTFEADAAVTGVTVGYSSPAICLNAGETVDLRTVSVQFTNGGALVSGTQITWKSGNSTVTSYTPAKKGVYPLTASTSKSTRTIYVVAKNAADSEYVLYEDDFTTSPDMSAFRVVEQPTGTSFSYSQSEGALILDASGSSSDFVRVLLPSFLDSFGDAVYSARFQVANPVSTSRYGSLMFRVQNAGGKNVPYLHAVARHRITTANGTEIGQRTEAEKWQVLESGAGPAIKNGSFVNIAADFCGSVCQTSINGTTYLTENETPYTAGAMGLLVNGARLVVDSVKVTVNPNSKPTDLPATMHDTRDPRSNIALTPLLVTEVKTASQLNALKTTLPAVAILDAAVQNGNLGVELGGKFTGIASAQVCDQVIPAYRVSSKTEAEALGSYAASLKLCDMYVVANQAALITAARAKCDALYGMLEVSSFDGNDETLRASLTTAGARGAILSAQHVDRDTVSYLQDRYLVVWQTVTASDISAVSAINNGVLGLVTPDVKATEACFTKYYTQNTVTRTPEIIGHRGAPTLAQENSLAGAVKAIEVGASMVECDVYLMKDGNVVIMHDNTLDRTTNGTGDTVLQTASSLQNVRIDSLAGVAAEPVPLLDDYFKKFQGTGEVIVIELKDEDEKIAEPLVKLIQKYGMQKQVVFVSFHADMIDAVRKVDPTIAASLCATSIYADEARSLEIAQEVLDRVIPGNTAYSPSQSRGTLGVNFFNDLAARGVTVWTFTVNNQKTFDTFFVGGVRAMTTNYPQWASAYIEDFRAQKNADGKVTLSATTYTGEKASTLNAELVVIDGEGSYDEKSGKVTLGKGAQGYFFRLTKNTPSGTIYSVVTPVFAAPGNTDAGISGDSGNGSSGSTGNGTGNGNGGSGGSNSNTDTGNGNGATPDSGTPNGNDTVADNGQNPDNDASGNDGAGSTVNQEIIYLDGDEAATPIWLWIVIGVGSFLVTVGVLLVIFRKQIFFKSTEE